MVRNNRYSFHSSNRVPTLRSDTLKMNYFPKLHSAVKTKDGREAEFIAGWRKRGTRKLVALIEYKDKTAGNRKSKNHNQCNLSTVLRSENTPQRNTTRWRKIKTV